MIIPLYFIQYKYVKICLKNFPPIGINVSKILYVSADEPSMHIIFRAVSFILHMNNISKFHDFEECIRESQRTQTDGKADRERNQTH